MFELQLGKNIEVYIDDMVVKSKVVSEHVGDLEDIFRILRKHKLCFNASKCSLAWDQTSSWATWSLTGELRLTLIRLRQLTVCNHLGIPKRSRS